MAKTYLYRITRDTNNEESAEYSTLQECEEEAIKKAKNECEELSVHGVHQHRIMLFNKSDCGEYNDIGRIELPDHDTYYNHRNALSYGKNDETVKYYQENLEIEKDD